jgi:hypothetical protein
MGGFRPSGRAPAEWQGSGGVATRVAGFRQMAGIWQMAGSGEWPGSAGSGAGGRVPARVVARVVRRQRLR